MSAAAGSAEAKMRKYKKEMKTITKMDCQIWMLQGIQHPPHTDSRMRECRSQIVVAPFRELLTRAFADIQMFTIFTIRC